MTRFFRHFYSLLFLGLTFSASAFGQVSNRIYTGARPLGLAGAYTAVANDGNAIYWNPAGLPLLQRQEITSMFTDLYGLSITNSYLGYVFPMTDLQAIGIDWNHEGFDDGELGFRSDRFAMAYGVRPHPMISIGGVVKYLNRDLSLDGNSIGKGSGFGFDLGLMFFPMTRLRFGVVGRDLGGSSISYDQTNRSEEIYPQKFSIGVAYEPMDGLLFTADVNDRVSVGSEYWAFNNVALRGGFQKPISEVGGGTGDLLYAGGMSLKYRFVQFDYAYEYNPILPATHRFSLSFFYNPSVVTIKDATIKPAPLFRSYYRNYEQEEFAEVVLKNSSQQELEVSVSLDVPTLMDQPYSTNLVLPPQSTRSYPLQVAFSERVLQTDNAAYDNLVQPTLRVDYIQDRNPKQAVRQMDPVYVLGKGKLTWENPASVAAFITPEHETVDRFARGVIQQYNDLIRTEFNNSNLGRALVLFNAVSEHGVVYQIDQKTPWFKIASDSTIFDNVQYPAELLQSRIGDCDDCMVLYTSLLENLGIDTKILDVFAPGEGHIYMMFDSGIPVDEAESFFLSEGEYVVQDGRVWIPVETTMFGFPFSDAWRNGSSEYHRRSEQGYINAIDVGIARAEFQAGAVAGIDIPLPAKEATDEKMALDVEIYRERIRQIAEASGVDLTNPDGLYDAGAAYLRMNRLNDAKRMLEQALQLEPDFGDAINALGVIAVHQRQYGEALENFNRAMEMIPGNAGIRLNIAITYFLQGRRQDALREYEEAVRQNSDYEGIIDVLN